MADDALAGVRVLELAGGRSAALAALPVAAGVDVVRTARVAEAA